MSTQPDKTSLSDLSSLQRDHSAILNSGRSSVIRHLRIVFPVVAICLLFAVFVLSDRKAPLEARPIEEIIPHEMGQNELVNPTFNAQDEEHNPFTITSERAFQEDGNSDQIILENPKADMRFDDGTRISLQGQNGTYQQDAQILHLEGHVLFSDEDYELTTNSVDINIEHQTATSNTPVTGHGPAGTIQASGLRANGQSSIFIFTGPATLTLNPQKISETP